MNKLIKYMVAIGGLIILAGCSTMPPKVVVLEKETFVLLKPNESLLQDCKEIAPPPPKSFIGMNSDQREDALARLVVGQYQNIKQCSKEKRAIRDFFSKNEKTLQEHNDRIAADIERRKQELSK